MMNQVSSSLIERVPGLWRLATLRNKAVDRFQAAKLKWPVYDVWRHLLNRDPRRLFLKDSAATKLSHVQLRVIGELKAQGISVVSVNELFPKERFLQLQSLTEALLAEPQTQQRIKEIQANTQKPSGSDKFYLLRLLGDQPRVDCNSPFLDFSLDQQILGIVSGYLEMYARLLYVNVWCNVPTVGSAAFSQRWHRDPEDKKQVKVFLYLRGVDENTGPFCFVPGTHNAGPYRKVFAQTMKVSIYPPENDVERLFKTEQRQVCIGQAGTLVFCDTSGIHKGGHPRSTCRVLLNAVYTTNAGLALTGRYFSISGQILPPRSFAAQYAVGELKN